MTINQLPAVETSGLVKTFGGLRAVDGVDLVVPTASVYAVLGPNGAGKTTAVRMLATLLRPDRGTARVLGYDVLTEADQVRRRISLTGQFASLDGDLTGVENLVLLARLLGHSRARARQRADELLGAFELAEAAGRTVRTYSGGMRRRLDIAASLITTPDLLFLDEPTTGLDPHSRNQVWDVVRGLAAAGSTVVLTTQYLDEADQLADRIAVINAGKVVAEGTSAELKEAVGSTVLHLEVGEPNDRPVTAHRLAQGLGTEVRFGARPSELVAAAVDPQHAAAAVADLARTGITLTAFMLGRPTLDEVFLALTGPSRRREAIKEEIA